MPERIDGTTSVGFRPSSAPPEEASIGTWRGEQVRIQSVPDLPSLIDAAKEELTFGHSERMEEEEIRELEIEEGLYGERVNEIEGVWKFLGHLPDLDLDRLRSLIAELEESGTTDPAEIIATVQRHFSDAAHAFAALECAEATFRAKGFDDLANGIAVAKQRFQTENGPAIRAGLNVTAAAFELADGDREAAAELRELYRTTVFGSAGPAAVYKGIVDQFGVEGFADRIKFLTRALGDDLAAAGPSIDRPRLQELLGELSELRVLDTVHERCGEMVDRLKRQTGVELSVTGVMQQLLPLTSEPVNGPSKPLAVPERLGIADSNYEAGIGVLREGREVLAMMPTGIYRDMDARSAVLRGVQEALDILIEREETA